MEMKTLSLLLILSGIFFFTCSYIEKKQNEKDIAGINEQLKNTKRQLLKVMQALILIFFLKILFWLNPMRWF